MKAKSSGITDVGLRRHSNQDSYFIEDKRKLYIVADGMGGHAAGDVASKLAVKEAKESILASFSDVLTKELSVENLLTEAFHSAHEAVRVEGEEFPKQIFPGTTMVALLLLGRVAHIANVGDSRAYLYRDGRLTQITRDQSLPGGFLAQCLGQPHGPPNVDLYNEPFKRGDLFLLCSDGLTNMLSHNQIEEILGQGSYQQNCFNLVDEANRAGGVDNITIIAVQIATETTQEQLKKAWATPRPFPVRKGRKTPVNGFTVMVIPEDEK